MNKVQEIQRGIAHKPFNPDSAQHLSFLENLEEKKQLLQQEYAFITF